MWLMGPLALDRCFWIVTWPLIVQLSFHKISLGAGCILWLGMGPGDHPWSAPHPISRKFRKLSYCIHIQEFSGYSGFGFSRSRKSGISLVLIFYILWIFWIHRIFCAFSYFLGFLFSSIFWKVFCILLNWGWVVATDPGIGAFIMWWVSIR